MGTPKPPPFSTVYMLFLLGYPSILFSILLPHPHLSETTFSTFARKPSVNSSPNCVGSLGLPLSNILTSLSSKCWSSSLPSED